MSLNWTEIVLAAIAILSGIVTHFLDKKKFNGEIAKLKAETDGDNIGNMDKSLDFYEKWVDNTNKRLDDMLVKQQTLIEENNKLREQIADLNLKLSHLTTLLCTDLPCTKRVQDKTVVDCTYLSAKTKSKSKGKKE